MAQRTGLAFAPLIGFPLDKSAPPLSLRCMSPAPVVPILFGGLFAWSIYRRVRRNIGQQPLRPVRHVFSLVIITGISLLLLGLARHEPHLWLGLGGGLLVGLPVGFWGLRLTRFETTEAGRFYTPNTRIGVAISLLFVGRLAYRFWVLRAQPQSLDHPALMQSPLTYFIFGLMAGYYLVYNFGLFRHSRTAAPAQT